MQNKYIPQVQPNRNSTTRTANDVANKVVPKYNHDLLPFLSPQGREIRKTDFTR